MSTEPNAARDDADRVRRRVVRPLLDWYRSNARDLPWRRPGTTPWGVLVSEVMLQQTPVARVEPVWRDWMARWPDPPALAAEPPGAAVRTWGTLGYPRRALRLHQAATVLARDYAGIVPSTVTELRRLPGIGAYTAAAVASFAYGEREVVLDTNVRRVLGRVLAGAEFPRPGGPARPERLMAAAVVPPGADAARWAVAVMEFGALVCTARAPQCDRCPIVSHCAWQAAGKPGYDGPPRRTQAYAGTDRQARGRILAALRATAGPVRAETLAAAWPDQSGRDRALAGLAGDGLVELSADGYRLPERTST